MPDNLTEIPSQELTLRFTEMIKFVHSMHKYSMPDTLSLYPTVRLEWFHDKKDVESK